MFLNRLSNIVEPRSRETTSAGPFSQIKISYRAVETLARVIDLFLIVIITTAGGIVYQNLRFDNHAIVDGYLGVGLIMGALYVYVGGRHGLYRLSALSAPFPHLGRTVKLWATVALLVTASLLFLEDELDWPSWPIIWAFPMQIILLLFARLFFGRATHALLSAGRLRGRRIVTIGESAELLGLSPSFLLQGFGLKEVCRVAIATNSRRRSCDIADDVDRAIAAANAHSCEEFLLALRWDSNDLLETIRARLRACSLPVRLLPDHKVRAMLAQHGFVPEGGFFPLTIQKAGLTAFETLVKRVLDVTMSGMAIVVLWPVFLIAAIAIKLDSAGPVIFRQKRAGLNAKEFVILKFRTMTVLEDGPAIKQASRDDHRVTRVGKFLRRSSVDELPQLFNVLKGDMSLVGPRPHAVAHDNEYLFRIADYRLRHHVKPGMTGWAQVNGLRGETPSLQQMAERVELDRWYINNWSLGLDIGILFRTCFEVLRDRAY
jgi:putative colanic acid biosysnthesis UDP-glucose lipid carrier transferase